MSSQSGMVAVACHLTWPTATSLQPLGKELYSFHLIQIAGVWITRRRSLGCFQPRGGLLA